MRLLTLFSVTLILLISCSEKKEDKESTSHASQHEAGSAYKDSVNHGQVLHYSTDGRVLGYGNYWYGIKNGPWVDLYNNGLTKDSIIFRYDRKEGPAFHFDSSGRLEFKQNYLDDKPVGETSSYRSGMLKEYIFKDFEGDTVFQISFNGSDTIQKGQLPYYKCDTIYVNEKQKKVHVFLYLVYVPGIEMHYKIAKVDKDRIISSDKITSDNCYYETSLDMLEQPLNYAIVMSFFNKTKQRNNLTVNVLK